MFRTLGVIAVWLLVLVPVRAAEPEGRLLRERWYESRAERGKLGWLHFEARQIQRGGQTLIRSTLREEFAYQRSGDPYKETMEHYTVETESGEVVELGYRTNLSKKQQLTIHGRPEGARLPLRVFSDDQPTEFGVVVPWEKRVLGLFASDRLFEGKSLKLAETITSREFSITANRVVPTIYTVKGRAATSFGRERRELLRVEQSYPKKLYLGRIDLWLDEAGVIVKIEEDTPSFGAVSYEMTTRGAALAPFEAKVADNEAPIAVNRPLPIQQGLPKELTVRVSLEGDDEPGTLFVQDRRQQIVKADTQAVEMRLLARVPREGRHQAAPAEEYSQSNFFIRSGDGDVIKLAREIVAEEKDARKRLRLIRRWLGSKFNGNYEVPFATADEAARTKEGDCTEMGVLAAALCRALGIPSRLAFGLVYDPSHPGFGGHLWTEVYLDGDWEPFDPTGVIDLLNAAYIKVADYSFKDVLSPDELVEVRRAFGGKMKVEILESK